MKKRNASESLPKAPKVTAQASAADKPVAVVVEVLGDDITTPISNSGESGETLASTRQMEPCVAFSTENGIEVIAANNFETIATLTVGPKARIVALAISTDRSKLASSQHRSNSVVVWDLNNSIELGQLSNGSFLVSNSLSFNQNGDRLLCSCVDLSIRMWDVVHFNCVTVILGTTPSGLAIWPRFNNTGELIFGAATYPDVLIGAILPNVFPDSIVAWNANTGIRQPQITKTTEIVSVFDVCREANILAFCPCGDREVHVINLETPRQNAIIGAGKNMGMIFAASFNSIGDKLVCTAFSGFAHIWSLETFAELGSFKLSDDLGNQIRFVSFIPEDNTILAVDDRWVSSFTEGGEMTRSRQLGLAKLVVAASLERQMILM